MDQNGAKVFFCFLAGNPPSHLLHSVAELLLCKNCCHCKATFGGRVTKDAIEENRRAGMKMAVSATQVLATLLQRHCNAISSISPILILQNPFRV